MFEGSCLSIVAAGRIEGVGVFGDVVSGMASVTLFSVELGVLVVLVSVVWGCC